MKHPLLTSLFACALVHAASFSHGEVGNRVSAQGRIEPEGGVVKVAAPYAFSAPQLIVTLPVKTGDKITQGQVLAALDSLPRLQATVARARADLLLAESRRALAQVREQAGEIQAAAAATASAQIELTHAENELKRSTQLDTQAAVAQMDIDKWQKEVNARRVMMQQMQHTHAALRDSLAAEVKTAAAEVTVAQAAVRCAEAEAAYGQVLAPSDGVVLKTLLHAGELAAGPLLELGDTRTMNVITEVYETDARLVQVGMLAHISSQALASPLKGKVIAIGQRVRKRDAFNVDPAARTDGRVVEVKVRLDDPTPVAGMTNLEVEVVIGGNDE
jgi:HlyD family secretion protein